MYVRLDQYEEATNAFENAVLFDPENSVSHNNLGVAQYQNGAYRDAVSSFQKAVDIAPQYQEAQNNLDAAKARVDPLEGLELEI